MPTIPYSDAELTAIRHSIANDDSLNTETRQKFAAMTDAELAESMDIIAQFLTLPERERKATRIITRRIAAGDRELMERIRAANRGELPHRQIIEEVLA